MTAPDYAALAKELLRYLGACSGGAYDTLRDAAAALERAARLEEERTKALAALDGLPTFDLVEQCQKRQAQLNASRDRVFAFENAADQLDAIRRGIEASDDGTDHPWVRALAVLQSVRFPVRSMTDAKPWTPPFCSNEFDDLECPSCGGAVRIREQETYFDGCEVEAYCADCHVPLEVQAQVTVEFSDPEVVRGDE